MSESVDSNAIPATSSIDREFGRRAFGIDPAGLFLWLDESPLTYGFWEQLVNSTTILKTILALTRKAAGQQTTDVTSREFRMLR